LRRNDSDRNPAAEENGNLVAERRIFLTEDKIGGVLAETPLRQSALNFGSADSLPGTPKFTL
jgi:hypothetical protein